jgi:hypothetical protein
LFENLNFILILYRLIGELGLKRLLNSDPFVAVIKQTIKQSFDEINNFESSEASKTAFGFYTNMICSIQNDPQKFIVGYQKEGDSFFSMQEVNEVKTYLSNTDSRVRESKLCEIMYHLLRGKLLPLFPEHYELINSERHEWIPPNHSKFSVRNQWHIF